MIPTIDIWLVIKSTIIGKIGAFFVASAPVILAVEMKNHVDAMITAIPPTMAVIVGVFALKKGQTRMFVRMDGHLSELLEINKKASKSEGKEEERVEARERADHIAAP